MLTVRNYIEAAKRRKKEETGEEGFSLIELIIVVVILGILVAIAIPIFGGIQETARANAVKAAAGNGASAAAAAFANGSTSADAASAAAKAGEGSIHITLAGSDATSVCVTAWDPNSSTYPGGTSGATYKTGPGC